MHFLSGFTTGWLTLVWLCAALALVPQHLFPILLPSQNDLASGAELVRISGGECAPVALGTETGRWVFTLFY